MQILTNLSLPVETEFYKNKWNEVSQRKLLKYTFQNIILLYGYLFPIRKSCSVQDLLGFSDVGQWEIYMGRNVSSFQFWSTTWTHGWGTIGSVYCICDIQITFYISVYLSSLSVKSAIQYFYFDLLFILSFNLIRYSFIRELYFPPWADFLPEIISDEPAVNISQ